MSFWLQRYEIKFNYQRFVVEMFSNHLIYFQKLLCIV